MPCYTEVAVNLENTALNRKARANLGIALEGELDAYTAGLVKQEASVLKAIYETRRINPRASIKRQGNRLQIRLEV